MYVLLKQVYYHFNKQISYILELICLTPQMKSLRSHSPWSSKISLCTIKFEDVAEKDTIPPQYEKVRIHR